LALVLFVAASIFIVLGEHAIWILQGQLSDPQAAWELGLVMSGIILLGTYVWAIVDTAVKPTSWYDEYESK
jgi:hypothetical protein